MGNHGSPRLRRLIVATSLVAALAIPSVASADTTGAQVPTIGPESSRGLTVEIAGAPRLMNKVVVTVPLRVVCDPLTGSDWETGQEVTLTDLQLYGEAQVLQAAGRSMAYGAGYLSGRATCDGSTVNAMDAVVSATGGTPFKPGAAVVGARVYAESDIGSSSGSTGPLSVRLR